MSLKRIKIGNIHPAFFEVNRFMNRFQSIHDETGIILKSRFFNIKYSNQYIYGTDSKVLRDIYSIIKDQYGSSITRDDATKLFDWNNIPKNIFKVKFGVCVLENNYYSGWDGTMNATWYDNNAPGRIINEYHVFWTPRLMCDVLNISNEDLIKLDIKESIPNLIKLKITSDGIKRKLIDDKIKLVLNATSE